jgi:hypothetical protein
MELLEKAAADADGANFMRASSNKQNEKELEREAEEEEEQQEEGQEEEQLAQEKHGAITCAGRSKRGRQNAGDAVASAETGDESTRRQRCRS